MSVLHVQYGISHIVLEVNVYLQCEEPTLRTSFLHKLSFEVERKENATKTLTELLFALTSQDTKMFGNVTHFTPAEIHYTANTLASLQHNILHGSDLPIIANITDAILRTSVTTTDSNVVEKKMTHGVSNASNIILDSIDHMLNNVKLNYKGKTTESLTWHVCVNFVLKGNFWCMLFEVIFLVA